MRKKILFIGAGASYGARVEFGKHPPLGLKLCEWLRNICPELINSSSLVDLHSVIRSAYDVLIKYKSESNYETFITLLQDRKDRINQMKLLMICFSDISGRKKDFNFGFKSQIDFYDRLVEKLDLGSGDWSVISLNYDILFEAALGRAKKDFFYPLFKFDQGEDQTKNTGVRIYKPHGSINFFAQPGTQVSFGNPVSEEDRGEPSEYQDDGRGGVKVNHPTTYAGMSGAENVLARASSSSLMSPVIANYTKGKFADTNERNLNSIRNEAVSLCRKAEEIVIIGVKPIDDPLDDKFVSDILKINYKKVTYVTFGDTDADTLLSMHNRAKIFRKGLSDYLK